VTVRELAAADIVGVAQCIAIDADTFPYVSVSFGERHARGRVWTARGSDPPRVLGFVAAAVRRRDQYIEALAVERGSRRRGIGRVLLGAVMAHARGARLETTRLHVWVGNRAGIDLYRSCGFVERQRVRRFYRPDAFGGSGDAYEMAWSVEGDNA
jgi:ribosomal protein S18 acetylase RimI-like enzyme